MYNNYANCKCVEFGKKEFYKREGERVGKEGVCIMYCTCHDNNYYMGNLAWGEQAIKFALRKTQISCQCYRLASKHEIL